MSPQRLLNLCIVFFIVLVVPILVYHYLIESKTPAPARNQTASVIKRSDFGLTVSEFQKAYEGLVSENAVPALHVSEVYSKNANETYFYTSDTVALEIETTGEKIHSVTVFGESSRGSSERKVIERVTLAYIFTIATLNPEWSRADCGAITNRLSENLKSSSVSRDGVTYSTRFYNGILMLSAKTN